MVSSRFTTTYKLVTNCSMTSLGIVSAFPLSLISWSAEQAGEVQLLLVSWHPHVHRRLSSRSVPSHWMYLTNRNVEDNFLLYQTRHLNSFGVRQKRHTISLISLQAVMADQFLSRGLVAECLTLVLYLQQLNFV
jgi:hypothetical protein